MTGREGTLRGVYDQVADAYADRFPTTEPEQSVDVAVLQHFASLVDGDRQVLDAGCGAGRMFPLLTAAGCRVAGVDLSPGMVRRARRDHPVLGAAVGSIAALPFASAAFDGVLAWYSTIHVPDPDLPGVVAELRRVLRPGGHVLVAFQVGSGVREVGAGYRALGFDVEVHRHDRTTARVGAVLADAGFVEVLRFERAAAGSERTAQAVLVARAG